MAGKFVVKTIEELKPLVGKDVTTGDWVQITQERIRLFAEATDDRQWIHLDAERCKRESPFGAPIAHGFLTLSLLPYLDSLCFEIEQPLKLTINAGLNKVRFLSPVVAGSRIRLRKKLVSLAEMSGGWRATWRASIEIEGQKNAACVAEMTMRYITGPFEVETE